MKARLNEIYREPYYPKGRVFPSGYIKKIVRTIELEAETEKELFRKAYPYQRSSRYANNSWFEFEDEELNKKFCGYQPTIDEYYGGGVVD